MIKNNLPCGLEFYIDNNFAHLLDSYNWYSHKTGKKIYVRGYLKGNRRSGLVYLHHLIKGKPDKPLEIDHKDGNGLNNCITNLRIANRSQNNANRKNVKGYYFETKTLKWRAEISFKNKKIKLGRFSSELEAQNAYKNKSIELYGSFSSRGI